MHTFTGPDGTTLAYHVTGEGEPLLVLPGGPMSDSAYLGDLGGLTAHRTLYVLDLRGTGRSGVPDDPTSYRCDRQVADVESFRTHLGLSSVDLLGHSAGASLAILYAARHFGRLRKLALITPSLRALGASLSVEQMREVALARAGEPWFAEALAALDAELAGTATEEDRRATVAFSYGRWDAAAKAHAAADATRRHPDAARHYYAEGAMDPPATRAALAGLTAPVLMLAGEWDVGSPPALAREAAASFPTAEVVVQPGAGHFPWLDDAGWFARVVTTFLG